MSAVAPNNQSNSEVRYFTVVADAKDAIQEIAKNSGWIMAAGIVSIVAGVVALMAPILATGITATMLATGLFVVGCINLCGTVFARKGLKLDSFLTGVVQVLLAAVMAFYPFASLASLTFLIAVLLFGDGATRAFMAVRNRELSGWGWMLASGIIGIATSVIVVAAMPTSSLWVIGILVGVSLITVGATRVTLALEARRIAKELV